LLALSPDGAYLLSVYDIKIHLVILFPLQNKQAGDLGSLLALSPDGAHLVSGENMRLGGGRLTLFRRSALSGNYINSTVLRVWFLL
jgi:hypothetical protein